MPLMAAEASQSVTFELIYNADKYDVKTKKWLREVKPPKTVAPTPQEIYEAFLEILEVNHDPKSGFVDVSIEFYSPKISVQWVEWLIEDINEEKKKLQVMVKIFGRKTPLELNYMQVEKE